MECLNCPKCYNYAYDTLIRPHPPNSSFREIINLQPIIRSAHTLTYDFMRASLNPKEEMHLVILCVETGRVRQPEIGIRHPITMMRMWIQQRLRGMGKLYPLHFFHSGGYALEDTLPIQGPVRMKDIPVKCLRIRIPPENECE
jgi:hypothetical protein